MPMSINRSPLAPVALATGGGETLEVRGMTIAFKSTGRQNDGQLAVLEVTEPPGSKSPTQGHKRTTVFIYVLEGRMTLRAGDQTIQVVPGGCACIPPGTVYTIANQSSVPARYLLVQSPAWVEDYITEVVELVKSEPAWPLADMSRFLAARAKYDIFDAPAE